MQAIQLKVNERRLIQELRHAFTSSTVTVLRELMQNARRAGATQVEFVTDGESLTVKDDGCGITDFAALLAIADTGWDQDTIAREHPYGLGFLSAIYAAKSITVKSHGSGFSACCADILEFRPVSLRTWPQSSACTEIRLSGVPSALCDSDTSFPALEDTLKHEVRGFGIRVYLNGNEIERPNALGPDFRLTPIGHIRLSTEYDRTPLLYYQGLPLYKSNRLYAGRTVIHLDQTQFTARLPDRDTLVDAENADLRIATVLSDTWRLFLLEQKAKLSGREFVEKYYSICVHSGFQDLLNDIHWVPGRLFRAMDVPQVAIGDDGYRFLGSRVIDPPVISEQALLALGRKLITLPDIDDGGDQDLAPYVFAHATRAIFADADGLGAAHWLNRHVVDLSDHTWRVVPQKPQAVIYWSGDWTGINVQFCESYKIEDVTTGETVTCKHVPLCTSSLAEGKSECAFIPKDCEDPSELMEQLCSFIDESDSYSESGHDAECAAFRRFACVHRDRDPARAIQGALVSVMRSHLATLAGQRFTLSINREGKLTVKRVGLRRRA